MVAKSIDSLVFDLDGTLWDASVTCSKAWNRSFEQMGIDHVLDPDTIRSFSGLRIEKIFEQHFSFMLHDQQEQLLELYKANEIAYMKQLGGELYTGIKETLLQLKEEYKLFIVSNCLEGYIENFIAFHQLQNIFPDFESSGNTGLPKSDNIKLIIERNDLHDPIYIGDTEWDQQAALKAGIPFIYAAYGFGKANDPKWMIKEFGDLKNILSVIQRALFL